MSRLKVIGKDGKTDITSTINPNLLKEWEEQAERTHKEIEKIKKHQAEKEIQPFRTNYLLGDLIKEIQSTTKLTKWVLFFTILIFILTIILLVKN